MSRGKFFPPRPDAHPVIYAYEDKRYEDASLNYTGINKHEGEEIGLYDTVLNAGDSQLFENLSGSA